MDLLRTLVDKVAPGRAAVVTVDVQNDFCHEHGFLGKLGAPMHLIQAMVPRLASFLDAARAHAVPVMVFVSDGTATTSQAAHDTTLANIDQFFGQVATADAIAAAWAATGAAAARRGRSPVRSGPVRH